MKKDSAAFDGGKKYIPTGETVSKVENKAMPSPQRPNPKVSAPSKSKPHVDGHSKKV